MWLLTLLIACSSEKPTEPGTVLFDQSTNAYEDPALNRAIGPLPTTQSLQGLPICGGEADLRVVGQLAHHEQVELLTHLSISVERNVGRWVIAVESSGQVTDIGEDGAWVQALPFLALCSRGNGAESWSTLATLRADGTLEH